MARTKAGLFYVGTVDGGPPAMQWFDLKGGTAYYEGAVLRLSATSGSAAKSAAAATSVLGVAGANVASADATTTRMPVYLANSRNKFEAVCVATGAPKTRLYDKVAIRVGTTHNYRIEGTARAGNATASCRIVDVNSDDATGTAANKRYHVVFNGKQSLTDDGYNAY